MSKSVKTGGFVVSLRGLPEARRLTENPCISPELVGGDFEDVEDVEWIQKQI